MPLSPDMGMTVHGDEWTLYHYGTRILTADERSGRSDVDKMSGLCRLLYGACRFRMHHGRIVED